MHLGIIPDGNRRWAKENGVSMENLLEYWTNNIRVHYTKFVSHCVNGGDKDVEVSRLSEIKEVSIYLLSKDNFEKRKDYSVTIVYDLLTLINELTPNNFPVKINVHGEIHLLPKSIQKVLSELTQKCSPANHTYTLNLAIVYDPFNDMKIADQRSQSQIDLVIRTGREKRSSGFFPWHTVYSEWYYSDTLWPDFNLEILDCALDYYHQRKRRFGG
jgi:undecaprenyl diphosphate synthase